MPRKTSSRKRKSTFGVLPALAVNEEEVDALDLFAENTGELYPEKKKIIALVQRAPNAAVWAWRGWVNNAVRQWRREGMQPRAMRFNSATCDALAHRLAIRYANGEN